MVTLLALAAVSCNTASQPVASESAASIGPCTLPISVPQPGGAAPQGAFLALPSGKVTIDPQGSGGAYYDRAFSRWVPVGRNAVSPDGTRYAVLDNKVPGAKPQARMHVVDVVTGKEQVYVIGPPGNMSAYSVVAFAPEGIWLSYAGYEGPGGGLFLFDLSSGKLTNPGVPGMVEEPGGGFVFDGESLIDPVAGVPGTFWFADGGPKPQAGAMGFTIPARVQRLTINGSKTDPWFTREGSWVSVIGTDAAGDPIITSVPVAGDVNSETFWLASGPADARSIALPGGDYGVAADSHGVWFGGANGLYLHSSAGVLTKVSTQFGSPAGGCM